ncbi:MAG: cache domain-containing protein [Candidatus Babeliales bacterium]|nr:cache domain-containing protein [Candidatus Babeliales bacterium]
MKKQIFLIMLISSACLTVDVMDAARLKSKRVRSSINQSVEAQTATVVKNDAMPEGESDDLDIAIESEDTAGGVSEPLVVKTPEPHTATKADEQFNDQAKKKAVAHLVDRGVAYLKKNEAEHTFGKFTHTNEFNAGELYLFVFDAQGVCLAHGQQTDLLWKNMYDVRDSFGAPIVKSVIDKAEQGGGWITYNWRNATKISYVQMVKKDDKKYIVGCGYYPHSKSDAVVTLVKGAVALFNDVKAQKRPKEEAFSTYSYSLGRFVLGDLTLNAIDFKGILMAQGNRPGLVGTNSWDYKDAHGKLINQEIVAKLKAHPGEGIWVDYIAHRARKHVYAERVEDDKGNSYAIFCGYYPEATRDQAIDLVTKGYQFMKAQGKSVAADAFSTKKDDTYRYGDLSLIVYDFKGVCIANGDDPELVGQNHFDSKDEDGVYYVRELLAKAKDGGGWVDVKIKNSFESFYVQEIDLGLAKYAIACGTFPITKYETMNLLVKSAAGFLQTNSDAMAFGEFTNPNGKFMRGDLSVFVFDLTGLCYAYGDEYDLIWQNLLSAKDDAGKSVATMFINVAQKGADKVLYTVNKAHKIAFVDKVEKGPKTYIIGSSFYK